MAKAKFDSHQNVTDQITAALREGTVPWQRPWKTRGGGRPRSLSTRKAYEGSNVLVLGLTAWARGYTNPWWGTMKRINELGGQVIKGQNRKNGLGGVPVVKWNVFQRPAKDADGKPVYEDGKPVMKEFWSLWTHTVFNAEQTEGLPAKYYAKPGDEDWEEVAEIPEPQAVLDGYLPTLAGGIRHGSDRAAYSPLDDSLLLPDRKQFDDSESYYEVSFHEAVHSTGHKSRLDRDGIARFDFHGSARYGFEELVAQIGAGILLAETGVEYTRIGQSADYIKGWLTTLEDDPKMIVRAASAAEKAVKLVLAASGEAVAEDGEPAEEGVLAAAAA